MKSQSVTPKPDAQLAKWCEIIQDTFAKPDVVEEGYLTTAQLADKLGKPWSTVRYNIAEAQRRGTVEVKSFRVETTRGMMRVKHYRPK